MPFIARRIAKFATADLRKLQAEVSRAETMLSSGIDAKAQASLKRYIAVIEAIGECRFHGEWHPLDKVVL